MWAGKVPSRWSVSAYIPYTETFEPLTPAFHVLFEINPRHSKRTYMADMNQSNNQPRITLSEASDYREGYANSVQVRASVWDFFLSFGTAHQDSPDQVTIKGFQGIYLSPQQAKALFNVLGQNLAQYEQAFGSISLEPLASTSVQRPLN
jgi:hypothetical protein